MGEGRGGGQGNVLEAVTSSSPSRRTRQLGHGLRDRRSRGVLEAPRLEGRASREAYLTTRPRSATGAAFRIHWAQRRSRCETGCMWDAKAATPGKVSAVAIVAVR